MTPPDRNHDAERLRRLMMAALDGEISARDRGELDRALAEDPDLATEWSALRGVKEVTQTMAFRRPPDEVWDTYWVSVYNRFERGAGWVLISLASIVLFAYGAWHLVAALLADTSVPAVVRVSLVALLTGGAILLVSVVREKLFVYRTDPYKEIER